MRDKKPKKQKPEESPPDHRIRPVEDGKKDEPPKIFKIVKRISVTSEGRREFLKKIAGAAGVTAVADILAGCDGSDYVVNSDGHQCTCHVVCACDTVGDKSDKYGTKWGHEWEGTVCTCDAVCTCNTVCTCHSVCTCDSEGGDDGYVYHYWYPN